MTKELTFAVELREKILKRGEDLDWKKCVSIHMSINHDGKLDYCSVTTHASHVWFHMNFTYPICQIEANYRDYDNCESRWEELSSHIFHIDDIDQELDSMFDYFRFAISSSENIHSLLKTHE